MPRPIYVPLFDSFFESSIMKESVDTRFVFLGLLRLASRAGANGEVDIPISVLANQLFMDPGVVRLAILRLMEPDPDSGSPDFEGRRIIPLDPARPERGWFLVNFGKYRELVHRANDTARKRAERAAKADADDAS